MRKEFARDLRFVSANRGRARSRRARDVGTGVLRRIAGTDEGRAVRRPKIGSRRYPVGVGLPRVRADHSVTALVRCVVVTRRERAGAELVTSPIALDDIVLHDVTSTLRSGANTGAALS